MCGILGGFSKSIDHQLAMARLRVIRHRGPDDSGIWHEDSVFLGNARLAILDVSSRGHQPMVSPDGRFVLVYNGELYNHRELRKSLIQNGHSFSSDCDTETLLHLWMQDGKGCLEKLNGIFAFAVYDTLQKILTVVRDPFGVKPLYYYRKGEKFLFSSELKALLNIDGLDYSLKPEVFTNYLLLQWSPGIETPFMHCFKLDPGCFLEVTESKLTATAQQRFFSLPVHRRAPGISAKTNWPGMLEKQLTQTLEAQLQSDAPVGFFLSGGLDSSLLCAMAARKKMLPEVSCFTIDTGGAMQDEGFADDFPFAKDVAKANGLKLNIVDGNIDLFAELDDMIWHLDEPQGDVAPLFVRHIAKAANAQDIKVLISGAGADDVFSGYRRHQSLAMAVAKIPRIVKRLAVPLAGLKSEAAKRRMLRFSQNPGRTRDERMIAQFFWQQPIDVAMLFQRELQSRVLERDVYAPFFSVLKEMREEGSLLNLALALELRTFLPHHNLNYTDKMGMAESVEIRVPYLDKDIIDLAAQMPPQLKMLGYTTKRILRQVAKDYLPEHIINRSKTGFGAPLRQWITGLHRGKAEERLFSGTLQQFRFFDEAALKRLWNNTQAGKEDGAYTIFTLLAIESWLRQFAGPACS